MRTAYCATATMSEGTTIRFIFSFELDTKLHFMVVFYKWVLFLSTCVKNVAATVPFAFTKKQTFLVWIHLWTIYLSVCHLLLTFLASIFISQMTNYLQCRRLVESFGNAVTFISFYFFALRGSYIHQGDPSLESLTKSL